MRSSLLVAAAVLSLGACAHARPPRAPKPAPVAVQKPPPPSYLSVADSYAVQAASYEVQRAIADVQRASLLLEQLRARLVEDYRIDVARGDELGEVGPDGRMAIKRKDPK